MTDLNKKIVSQYGNQLRIRVCGICIEDEKILLVRHHSLGEEGIFWSPPGGGMEYGQTASHNLKREFFEETGLKIKVHNFLFVHEYLSPPLHAVELFYEVEVCGGRLIMGSDPEMTADAQIIKEVKFISFKDLLLAQKSQFHNIFSIETNPEKLIQLRGYYHFP